ncbi:MAG: TetR/AcrR family transcriptional regulator [Eubacteriaceae bacterium]|jgi:AcrR family transcriptional regulator|nr:TetR/AcrR family transcriptional regulator [Eubacteriaceae bacterium]
MYTAKEKIKNAFLDLYSERPIEKISVKLLTRTAGVNRGTFYDYYTDIYDLLDQIESEFISNVTAMIEVIVSWLLSGDSSRVSDCYADFFEENRRMLFIFFKTRPSRRLQNTMKSYAQTNVCKFLGVDRSHLSREQQYTLEYIAGGQLSIVSHWFAQNNDLDFDSFADLIRRINTTGAFTCLLADTGSSRV